MTALGFHRLHAMDSVLMSLRNARNIFPPSLDTFICARFSIVSGPGNLPQTKNQIFIFISIYKKIQMQELQKKLQIEIVKLFMRPHLIDIRTLIQ